MVNYYKTSDTEQTNFSTYAEEINQFAIAFTDRFHTVRDYGNGVPIKTVEVYTLSLIEQNPGITVSELAQKQRRTKGTVSLNVSSLEKAGYIYREKRSGNAKVAHLYTTPDGERLSTLYTSRTTLETMKAQEELLKTCSKADLNAFCRVLHQYLRLLISEPAPIDDFPTVINPK